MNLQADDLPHQTFTPHDDPAPSAPPKFTGTAPTTTPSLSHAPPPATTTPTTSVEPDHVADTPTDPPTQQLAMETASEGLAEVAQDGRVAAHEDKDGEAEPEIGPQPAQHRIKEEGEVSLDHVNGQTELFEHASGPYLGAGDGSGVMVDDGQTWIGDNDQDLKRVYELVGARWVDKGTAFCFGQFAEETNEALLIARSERNYNIIILSTTIRSNDVYQRQQETLIVWTEPDGVDYALSFQDAEGCAEVWNFIMEVQRHMNSVDTLSSNITISSSPLLDAETSVTTASIIRSGHLPTPTLGIIGEIERAIKTLARTVVMKERICEYIQHEDYIKSLIHVMQTAEELESLENLHALCSLMQTILMLNDHGMYEHIMDDELFFGVVGMLEYDPDFPDHKANYREFLHEQSHFHQPIPIRDPLVQRKVHNAYRLQFLKDVVLARAIDDSTFNVINSCILFNQIDIISHVQHDPHFLRDLISLFVDEAIFFPKKPPPPQQAPPQGHLPPNQIIISLNGGADDDMDVDPKPEEPGSSSSSSASSSASPSISRPLVNNSEAYKELRQYYQQHYSFAPRHDLSEAEINLRREVIILLQQLCVMGKNVQLPARLALFRNLVDRGIIFAVQWAISLPDREEASKSMISAGGEVLSTLLDHDLNGVRSHVIKHVDAIERERGAKKKYAEKGETLLDAMCRIMATTKDMAVQSQIGDALKTWLEIPPAPPPAPAPASSEAGGSGGGPSGGEGSGPPPKAQVKKEGDTERFLDYFYKNCASVLFKPLMELPEWKNVKEPILPLYREEANRFTYLADLFHSFVAQHGFRSQLFCITSSILGRIASLLKAKDKHLRHSAFRIYRFLLRHNSPVSANLTNMMIKLDVFRPILELTLQESRRDNLLSCSCHELFDSMRRENMKELIKFCMTTHEDLIRKLAKTPLGGQRFELFIQRYEINCQPPPPESPESDRTDARAWSGPSRGMVDEEEDDYFNGDDDTDEEINTVTISSRWHKSAAPQLSIPPISGIKTRRKRHVRAQTPSRPPAIQKQPLGVLLDYDDEDEESSSGPESSTDASTSKNVLAPSPELFGSNAASTSISPNQPREEEDEEDLLLESLVSPSISSASTSASPKTQSRSATPSPSPSLATKILSSITLPAPPRMGEKRRREEEEEEDGLERLRKSKKTATVSGGAAPKPGPKSDSTTPSTAITTTPNNSNNSNNANTTTATKSKGGNANKTGDDPPPNANRVWRVKVGGASWMSKLAPQKSTVTSQPGAKDADTG